MLNEKKGEFLRLTAILALIALTVGIVFVYSAKVDNSAQRSVPTTVKGSNDTTFNFSITVDAGSNTVQRVDVNRPTASPSFTVLNCPVNFPAGWDCQKISPNLISFTDAVTGITSGNNLSFEVNATASGTTGNSSWIVNTYENTAGDSGTRNDTKFNVTIDADAPLIFTVNVSSTNGTLDTNNLTAAGNRWIKLSDLVFNVTITDVFDNIVNASIYLSNTSIINVSAVPSQMPNPGVASSYNHTITLTSKNPATGRFNGTLSSTLLNNGSVVYFVIVANDSVGNVNLSNSSSLLDTSSPLIVTASAYNFTIDGASPVLSSPNMSDIYDAAFDNITTSSTETNFTVRADDFGGSGVSRVELAVNISGVLVYAPMQQPTAASKRWNYTGTLQSLGVPSGDGNYTVWFRAYDNVTNVAENSVFMNVLVDDLDFAVTVQSDATNNYTTSNATGINLTITLNANLNLTAGNVTINGPDGFRWNMTLVSNATPWDGIGTGSNIVYQSTWFSSSNVGASVINRTLSNLSDLGCWVQGIGDDAGDDGDACTLQLMWNDLFGRQNSTNITITVDNIAPRLLNASANATSSSTRVVRGGLILNFSVNVENNVQNVTIHNGTNNGRSLNSTLMTAVGGTNYTATLSANQLCNTNVEGTCRVNFTSTDKANNINTTSITFIVDNSAPLITNLFVNGTVAGTNNGVLGTSVRLYRSSDYLNITFNVTDQVTNVTQVRIGNATMNNASIFADDFSYNNVSTLSAFGCSSNVEGSDAICIITVEAYDNATIDSSRNVNSSMVNFTFQIDDLTPRVLNFSTDLVNGNGRNVTGVNVVVNFSVNVSEANIWNVTIQNTTAIKMNRTGAVTDNTSTETFWAMVSLSTLGCSADGDCRITVNATDGVGNNNASEFIFVTSDSTGLSIISRTFNAVFVFDNTPTLHVNTSKAALCRYSTTGVLGYSNMNTQFGSEGSRNNSFTIPATADGTYEYDVSCVDVAGVGEVNSTVRFTINTINATTISIDNSTQNVVFYFVNTPTITVNLSANALCRYSTTGVKDYTTMTAPFNVNGTRHNSFTLPATADGTYTYDVACTTANEQNQVHGIVTFTVDMLNDTIIIIDNRTLGATFISATPTVHVNTSAPALCRYSTDGTTNYSQMSTQFGTQDSRLNSFTVGSDLLDADYTYDVSCVTANNQNVVSSTVSFTVDTTSLWNITLGATGTNGVKKDYFSQANKFYSFALPKSNVLSTTSLATDYNVTNVLASLLSANPTGTTSNLSVLFAYNRTGDKWTSYVPGRANNDFNNFTTDTMDYYVNLSAANERIEIR